MLSICRFVIAALVVSGAGLWAQDVPTVSTALMAQSATPGGPAITVDLREYFGLPSVSTASDRLVQFDTVMGLINVELKPVSAPTHVTNFLRYVDEGAYTNTFFHRAAAFDTSATTASIIQAGGFKLPYSSTVIQHDPLGLESDLPNKRGSLAAARTNVAASATNQFYFNVTDNSSGLPSGLAGGYSVYGQVIGGDKGLAVLDAIAAVPRYNAVDGSANTSAFTEIPLRNKTNNTLTEQNLILIRSVKRLAIYPDGTTASVLAFSAQSSDTAVAQVSVSGSTLTITPGTKIGSSTVTVQATDTNGNVATGTFTMATTAELAIVRSPRSQVTAEGDTVAFDVVAVGASLTYQWKRDGVDIPNVSGPVILRRFVSQAEAGLYTVEVKNATGSVTSAAATLTVLPGASKARLNNLSVRSFAGEGDETLIAGFSLLGSSPATLVLRGIGPTLTEFGVTNVLADPQLELFFGSESQAVNDNWSGVDGSGVGGFRLPAGSKDAVLAPTLTVADQHNTYTAHVKGADGGVGEALVEIYEVPQNVTSTELVNLSARTLLPESKIITAGFNLTAGTNRTVLLRAIGPGLATLGLAELTAATVLSDPRITLFDASGTKIDENDDWGGRTAVIQAMENTGAFTIPNLVSKDAMLLVTLPPGGYTLQLSGAAGTQGVALIELYMVR